MSTHEATVEVLTAEVRVLMVGSRQVTLSVYAQLDSVNHEDIAPFGRVRPRDSDPRWPSVIGRDRTDGTLVRSSAPKWEQLADYNGLKSDSAALLARISQAVTPEGRMDALGALARLRLADLVFGHEAAQIADALRPVNQVSLPARDSWRFGLSSSLGRLIHGTEPGGLEIASLGLQLRKDEVACAAKDRVQEIALKFNALPLIVLAGLR